MALHPSRLALGLLLLLGGSAGIAAAQTVPLSASHLIDAVGNPFSGELDICPVLSSGIPTAFHYGGGKTGLSRCAVVTVINGVFSATVPDTYLTAPQNLCLALHAWDPVSNADDLALSCVQPSIQSGSAAVTSGWCTAGGACNLDNYTPNLAVLPVAGAPVYTTGSGAPGGSCSSNSFYADTSGATLSLYGCKSGAWTAFAGTGSSGGTGGTGGSTGTTFTLLVNGTSLGSSFNGLSVNGSSISTSGTTITVNGVTL